jgi:HK97 family phage portal protein
MGFVARLLGREQRSATIKSNDPFLSEYFGMRDTAAGVHVSPYFAENLSAVFSAVQRISETVASLRLAVFRKTADGREEARAHPVSRLLSGNPNPHQSAFEFIEQQTALCLLRGNSYARIIRDNRGAPIELLPLHPDCVSPLLTSSGTLVYDVTPTSGNRYRLLDWEMLHLRDRQDNGLVGKSRLARARETFATALATENYAASTFRNSAAMSGVLSHPGQLNDDSATRLRSSFESIYRGSENAGRVAVLEEGLTWTQISVSPDDAQMLESRKFSVEQIARIFCVPPPMLGHMEGSNYSSVSELGRWYVQYSIVPWLRRWESTIERALLSDESRRQFEVEFDCDELLRGDMLTRWQSYRIMRELGAASANELRRWEHLNPRTDPDGDAYLSPLNMQREQGGEPKII